MGKVLLIGGSGMLGHDAKEFLSSSGLEVEAPSSRELDASCRGVVEQFVKEGNFTHIVNCAAYTDTVGCERQCNRLVSFRLNATLPIVLANACKLNGCKLVHISTNEVFSDSYGDWKPRDERCPTSVYGMEKAAAELGIESKLPSDQFAILRASWLFGAHRGKSFVHKVAGRIASGSELYGVIDEVSTPTSTRCLSTAILEAIVGKVCGTCHVVQSGGCVSRMVYMKRIVESFHKMGKMNGTRVEDIVSARTNDIPGLRKVGRIVLSDGLEIGYGNTWQHDLDELVSMENRTEN